MKKFVLFAFIAVAVALNAQARDRDEYRGKYQDKDYSGPVASVPL
jgi:hypothetical protein